MTKFPVFRKLPVLRKTKLISPYRYPGAKGRHMEAICELSNFSIFSESTYVEPFAGGGSALFYLMSQYEKPKSVIMNDLDQSMYAFWKCMENVSTKDELIDRIVNAVVTTEERLLQQPLMNSKNIVEAAFAGIFINRTSFSGIMRSSVGPIGGKEQKSRYPVDCRYNSTTLKSRIEMIYKYLNDITGTSKDFADSIIENDNEGTFIYCDPPYYQKGNILYRETMNDSDHVRLFEAINSLKYAKCVLSYDDCDRIRELYKGFEIKSLDAFYSVSVENKPRKSKKEVVIFKG